MNDPAIKDYLSQIGIRRISELDTALIAHFGQADGGRHIERLTELFDQSRNGWCPGQGTRPISTARMRLSITGIRICSFSLLAASFYDRIFFRRVLNTCSSMTLFLPEISLTSAAGNGFLTCFLALQHPGARSSQDSTCPKCCRCG